jgi:maleylpyruvate isomerase
VANLTESWTPNVCFSASPTTLDLMTSLTRADSLVISGEMAEVRAVKLEATQRLLGSTMGISDEQWQSASRLPGWTRAHVATHLARNADAMTTLVEALARGERPPLYPSISDRDREIERGSERDGLALQIDLDTSAGRLHEAFDRLVSFTDPVPVELAAGVVVDATQLPAVRLAEVLLHHVDLDVGYEIRDIPDQAARWLLEWVCFRLQHRPGTPAMRVVSASGLSERIGGSGFATTIRGEDAALAGWLSGRGSADGLSGTDSIALPLLG